MLELKMNLRTRSSLVVASTLPAAVANGAAGYSGFVTVTGFSRSAGAFFTGLAANNTRVYWLAHKNEFESLVREPLESLLAALPEPYDSFRTFRMNRDVRFSNDKSPYKTAHSAVQRDRGAARYIQYSSEGLLIAVGAYQLAPDQLARFRAAIDAPASGIDLERIVDQLTANAVEVGSGGAEPLVTAPRGFDQDHPRIRLLRMKGISAVAHRDPAQIEDGETLLADVIETFETCEPLHAWLRDHVGDSTAPRGR